MATGDAGLIVSQTWFPKPEIIATYFDDLGIYVRSYREPLTRAVKKVVIPSIQENFTSGGRPETWAPLAEVTWKKRERKSQFDGPLIAKKRLQAQAKMFTAWTINKEEATTKSFSNFNGGKAWYGDLHQEGFITGNAEIPARPFMMIQEEDILDIEIVFYEWLGEQTKRAGFKLR